MNGAADPFTLSSFTGTPPNRVNNVSTPGNDSNGGTLIGVVGYVADFNFNQAYRYYRFDASTLSMNQSNRNVDDELSAVASIP